MINQSIKSFFGARPQMECWNAGKMEEWVWGNRWNGLMVEFIQTLNEKLEKWVKSFCKPLFQNSTIPLFHPRCYTESNNSSLPVKDE
jgi:hypothetical protein